MMRILIRNTDFKTLGLLCLGCLAVSRWVFGNQGVGTAFTVAAACMAVLAIFTVLTAYLVSKEQDKLLPPKPAADLIASWEQELKRTKAELADLNEQYTAITARREALTKEKHALAQLLALRDRAPGTTEMGGDTQ